MATERLPDFHLRIGHVRWRKLYTDDMGWRDMQLLPYFWGQARTPSYFQGLSNPIQYDTPPPMVARLVQLQVLSELDTDIRYPGPYEQVPNPPFPVRGLQYQDYLEVPQTSGRWYIVQAVENVHLGYPHEFRVAHCAPVYQWPDKQLFQSACLWPIPLPTGRDTL